MGLVFSSYENRSNVFVHPVEIESARSDKPSVSFEQVGEQHFLSRIQTATTFITSLFPARRSGKPQ